jgi:CxxC-x17-CxxC domain-containing protein
MFKATCASCGNIAEVPFKPNGSRPVYCRDCFKKQEGGDSGSFERRESRGFGGRDSRGFGEEKQMFHATCANCGNDCEVPFRPTGERPVYCKNCFNKGGDGDRKSAPSVRPSGGADADQFRALSAKLDAIIKLLTPASSSAKATEDKPKEVKADKKAKAVKKTVSKKKK